MVDLAFAFNQICANAMAATNRPTATLKISQTFNVSHQCPCIFYKLMFNKITLFSVRNRGGCKRICMNGGTCINATCTCSPGWSGEFCTERKNITLLDITKWWRWSEGRWDEVSLHATCIVYSLLLILISAICREPCLHDGRCIAPDRCVCFHGLSGKRCEIGMFDIWSYYIIL